MPTAVSSVVPLGRGAVLSGVWKGTWLHSARICLFDRFPRSFFLNCHFEGNTRTLRSLGSCLSCDFDNPHGFSPTFLATKDIPRCQEIANGTAGIAIAGNYTESWRESWCFGQLQDLDCSSVKFQFDASWPVGKSLSGCNFGREVLIQLLEL